MATVDLLYGEHERGSPVRRLPHVVEWFPPTFPRRHEH
jgi:hypothetical protein